jgi:hypothetical protein
MCKFHACTILAAFRHSGPFRLRIVYAVLHKIVLERTSAHRKTGTIVLQQQQNKEIIPRRTTTDIIADVN